MTDEHEQCRSPLGPSDACRYGKWELAAIIR
jgi:hypothetical protein